MNYELYTWPKCDQCDQTKTLFAEKGINYETIALSPVADLEQKRLFGKITDYIGGDANFKRNNRGKRVFPILVERNGAGIEKVTQGFEDISSLFQ